MVTYSNIGFFLESIKGVVLSRSTQGLGQVGYNTAGCLVQDRRRLRLGIYKVV